MVERPPSDDPPACGVTRRQWWAWAIGMTAVAGCFLLLKSFSIHPYESDEHIYTYQAYLVSKGATPYADVFIAHPPAQTLVIAAQLAVTDFNLTLSRLHPIGWCLVGGLALAWLVRREVGPTASVLAMALYLLARATLFTSSHATGVNMAVALVILALVAVRSRAIVAAAALCVAALATRLYVAPVLAAIVVWQLLIDWRSGLRLIGWALGIGGVVTIALGVWCGFGPLFEQTVLYHMRKTPIDGEKLRQTFEWALFFDAGLAMLFVASIPALAWAWWQSRRSESAQRLGLVTFSAITAMLWVAMLTRMDRVWGHYFMPAFPFAAIAGGWLLAGWFETIVRLARSRGRPTEARLSRAALVGGSVLALMCAVGWWLSPMLESRLPHHVAAMNLPPEQRAQHHPWTQPMLPAPVADVLRTLLWKDTQVIGRPYRLFHHVLWHEAKTFDIAEELVAVIRKHTTARGELFGDSMTVPLLSLMSGRPIAAHQADTNVQRYRSGSSDVDRLLAGIDQPTTELIILSPSTGIALLDEVFELVRDKYRLVHRAQAASGKTYMVFKRRPAGPKG